MESKRQQKLGRLILKDMSDIFQKEGRSFLGSTFITVTQVRVTPDLGTARVFLSVLVESEREKVLGTLEENMGIIRNALGQKLRHQIRKIPVLEFFIDDTAEYAAKITKMIDNLDIRTKEDDDHLSDDYQTDKLDLD
ncbi:MAG: 30S ribosome-binding factor RbfA [Cytophagales bacterium]|nr:30S ribosome-binding factor RbfA [Cytophagales bacterium]